MRSIIIATFDLYESGGASAASLSWQRIELALALLYGFGESQTYLSDLSSLTRKLNSLPSSVQQAKPSQRPVPAPLSKSPTRRSNAPSGNPTTASTTRSTLSPSWAR
jgi:hypothetical protein